MFGRVLNTSLTNLMSCSFPGYWNRKRTSKILNAALLSLSWKYVLTDSNGIRTHLVCKRTLNHLAKLACLAKWMSIHLWTNSLWVRVTIHPTSLPNALQVVSEKICDSSSAQEWITAVYRHQKITRESKEILHRKKDLLLAQLQSGHNP